MLEENKDPKQEAEETADQNNDQSDEVVLSKEEFEKLSKKAQDFERSIELKRLAKLKTNDENNVDVSGAIEELKNEVASLKVSSFNSKLEEAYHEFVKDNPWVNDDAHFDKLKDNFSTTGTETKDQLLSKLKNAAQTSFPQEYEKFLEDKIKAKLLSDNKLINNGGTGVSDNVLHPNVPQKTEEELHKERLGALLRDNLTWLPKK